MIPIALTIIAATWAGLAAEHRMPGRAAHGSRRALLISLYVILPPLVFLNLARTELDSDFAIGIVLALLVVAICAALAFLVGDRLLALRRDQTGALMACMLVSNSGYLGLPLVAATLGFDRLGEAVAFDVLVSGTGLLLGAFAVGAAFGTRAGEGPRERAAAFFRRNIPLYAAALAVIAPDFLAPDWAVDASRVAVIALLPVGFFAVGAALAEDAEAGSVGLPPRLSRPVLAGVSIKLALMPALLFGLAAPLIDLPTTFLVLAAMPAGLSAMVVAHAYGLDLRITAGIVTWTTAIVVPVALVASLI